MIAIVNIDKNPRETGKHLYSLRINNNEICTFHHDRERPLWECLSTAAIAAMEIGIPPSQHSPQGG